MFYIENGNTSKFVGVTEPVINRFAAYILNTISGKDNVQLPFAKALGTFVWQIVVTNENVTLNYNTGNSIYIYVYRDNYTF